MKEKNICKFISQYTTDTLETHCFIYETDCSVMASPTSLKTHRAILVKNGSVNFFIDNEEYCAKSGTLIFAFSGECIYAKGDSDSEYLYINYSGSRASSFFKTFNLNKTNRIFSGFSGLIPLWHDSLVRTPSENIHIAAEGVLLYTISRLSSDSNPQINLVQKIIDITEENFSDPELSISSIANNLSYNAKYLSHLFKEKKGVGYTEYLRMYRIKNAIILMEHGIDSVKNIASLCGFSDPLYFSSVFKKSLGVSPSEYKSRKKDSEATND